MRGLRQAQLRSHSNDKLRDIRDHINTAACAIAPCDQALSFSQEKKAGGHYAAGLLLQLPAPGVRFRCDSMPKV
jgi:hypothetical protein